MLAWYANSYLLYKEMPGSNIDMIINNQSVTGQIISSSGSWILFFLLSLG